MLLEADIEANWKFGETKADVGERRRTSSKRVPKPTKRALAASVSPPKKSQSVAPKKNRKSEPAAIARSPSPHPIEISDDEPSPSKAPPEPKSRSHSHSPTRSDSGGNAAADLGDDTSADFADDELVPDDDDDSDIEELEQPAKRRKKDQGNEEAREKRVIAGSGVWTMLDGDSWHHFERKLLVKVAKLAKLAVVEEDDIHIEYHVPRHVVNYVELDGIDGFKHMIKSATKCKDPVINLAVAIKAAVDSKKDDSSDDDDDKKKKSKKSRAKSKILSEKDISPANAEINQKINLLRAKYTCHTSDSSDY
ncbi:hypothetical protein B0H13DRAFT_2305769 [Mycena leptocephala]|nr:hypothetical protein B0H13DRAFT_2305769 [Mycena leptocephala]